MLNLIVGENASGKTLYLDNIYCVEDCVYNRRMEEARMRPIDRDLVREVYPDAVLGTDVVLPVQSAYDEIEVQRWLHFMLKKSNILLLDEIDTVTCQSDKYILYKAAMLISRYKSVIAVTHDEDFTAFADRVCAVRNGSLIDLTRDEMLWEIYRDEKMVTL